MTNPFDGSSVRFLLFGTLLNRVCHCTERVIRLASAIALQGILMRHRVDLREWVLSTIRASGGWAEGGTGAGAGSGKSGGRGAGGTVQSLHPSLLRVVCLFAAACVAPPHPMSPTPGEGGGSTFVMKPVLPMDVMEIVQAVDWVRNYCKTDIIDISI